MFFIFYLTLFFIFHCVRAAHMCVCACMCTCVCVWLSLKFLWKCFLYFMLFYSLIKRQQQARIPTRFECHLLVLCRSFVLLLFQFLFLFLLVFNFWFAFRISKFQMHKQKKKKKNSCCAHIKTGDSQIQIALAWTDSAVTRLKVSRGEANWRF